MHIRLEQEIGLFKDGDRLPDGKVVSLKRSYPSAVYRCACGREQLAECEGFTGGVGVGIAQTVGWERQEPQLGASYTGWVCPFCSGNTEKLFPIYDASSST